MTDHTNNFRNLHSGADVLLLPNAWDAGSARLIESLGAKAIATTSAGVAWALGYRDGRSVPFKEIVDVASRMARVLSVPLSFDIEHGYSDDPNIVAENVMRLVDLGVAGINIEDGPDDPTSLVVKLYAIRNALSKANADLYVNVRSDVILANLVPFERQIEESIARGKLYKKSGADGLFLPGINRPQDITSVVEAIDIPLNVMALPGLSNSSELSKLGVRRLSAGSGISQAVLAKAKELGEDFLHRGSSVPMYEKSFPYSELQGLF